MKESIFYKVKQIIEVTNSAVAVEIGLIREIRKPQKFWNWCFTK